MSTLLQMLPRYKKHSLIFYILSICCHKFKYIRKYNKSCDLLHQKNTNYNICQQIACDNLQFTQIRQVHYHINIKYSTLQKHCPACFTSLFWLLPGKYLKIDYIFNSLVPINKKTRLLSRVFLARPQGEKNAFTPICRMPPEPSFCVP